MAYTEWGVWSLVASMLIKYAISTFLLWLWINWKPKWDFSFSSFKELFSFSSKLLISGLIDTIYRNVYYIVIGKYFTAVELGYYTRADQFQALPSSNLQGIIGRVSYPVLSTLQHDIPRLSLQKDNQEYDANYFSFDAWIGCNCKTDNSNLNWREMGTLYCLFADVMLCRYVLSVTCIKSKYAPGTRPK